MVYNKYMFVVIEYLLHINISRYTILYYIVNGYST